MRPIASGRQAHFSVFDLHRSRAIALNRLPGEIAMELLRTFAMTAAAISALLQPSSRSEAVLVTAVLDGDTIQVAHVGRVRLLGIDAPEIGRGFDTPAPFAREAKDRLASLVLRRWIRLESDGPRDDAYNRHLAYVLTEDGQFVNAMLLREGLARVSARLPLTRLPELQRAEADAQMFRRGMWGQTPQIPSQQFTASPPPKPSRAGKGGATKTSKSKRRKRGGSATD
jgi:micrococcal nuclease